MNHDIQLLYAATIFASGFLLFSVQPSSPAKSFLVRRQLRRLDDV
jgi:hypothetical protein